MSTKKSSERQHRVFKTCPTCAFSWASREAFLGDAEVFLVGYQANFKHLLEGFFLFNHSCGTTLASPAGVFKDLYDGEIFEGRATGSSQCPGHCLHKHDLGPCPARCECAFVRKIIERVGQWPKQCAETLSGKPMS